MPLADNTCHAELEKNPLLCHCHSSAALSPNMAMSSLCSALSVLSVAQVDQAASSEFVFTLLLGAALSSATLLNYALDRRSYLASIYFKTWASIYSGFLSPHPLTAGAFPQGSPLSFVAQRVSVRPMAITSSGLLAASPPARRLGQPDWCRSPALANRSRA